MIFHVAKAFCYLLRGTYDGYEAPGCLAKLGLTMLNRIKLFTCYFIFTLIYLMRLEKVKNKVAITINSVMWLDVPLFLNYLSATRFNTPHDL